MRSIDFWKNRYKKGGDSGIGSQGSLLKFKVEFLNKFIEDNEIKSVLDFGHGDLNIAKSIKCEKYTGIDIFKLEDKNLNLVNCKFDEYEGSPADLVICLDVLYHILKEEQAYMQKSIDKMIEKASKFIIVYAQDSRNIEFDEEYSGHLYNSKWIQYCIDKKSKCVKLIYEQPKPEEGYTSAQFFIFEKINEGA